MGIINNEVFKNQYGYTFDDLLDGYQRSLKLIKKIDRAAYNQIVKIFKYYQTTQSDKFNQMLNALKEHFLDEENDEKCKNLWHNSRLYTEIKPKTINLLFGYSGKMIEPDSWDMIDVTKMTAFPFEFGEKEASYTIAPIFHDYKNINAGLNNGIPFYSKAVLHEFQFPSASTESEREWVLYKDENNTFKVCKTNTIKDRKSIKNMNMEL